MTGECQTDNDKDRPTNLIRERKVEECKKNVVPSQDEVTTESESDRSIGVDQINEIERDEEGEEIREEEAIAEEENVEVAKKVRKKKEKGPDLRVVQNINVRGPFPGGPKDNSLLRTFYDHVALAVWLGEERDTLRMVNHTKKLRQWDIDNRWEMFNLKVNSSGISSLRYALPSINKALISAFLERWHPETNSFHLPFGEMTITLEDVKQITGLAITGELLTGSTDITYEDGENLLHAGLGVDKVEVRKEFARHRAPIVRLEWIRKRMADLEDQADIVKVNQAVRGYLLYSVGANLLADKSGDKVHVAYMKIFMDVDQVSKYAFGTSGLAYLYRQLGYSSRRNVSQLCGFISLLEVWIYEHFPCFGGLRNHNYDDTEPLQRKWLASTNALRNPDDKMKSIREELDQLTSDAVVWDPYKDRRQSPREEINFYTGCLSCMQDVEGYYPDRVLRQFGLVQGIPLPPLKPSFEDRRPSGRLYRVRFADFQCQFYMQWFNHVLAQDRRGSPVVSPSDCVEGYLDWFLGITHPYVQHPDRLTRPLPIKSVDHVLPHARNAKAILKALIEAGAQHCGRAFGEIKKAYVELELCVAGSSAQGEPTKAAIDKQEEEEQEHATQEEQVDVRRKKGKKSRSVQDGEQEDTTRKKKKGKNKLSCT